MHTKVEEHSLPYYSAKVEGRISRFIPLERILTLQKSGFELRYQGPFSTLMNSTPQVLQCPFFIYFFIETLLSLSLSLSLFFLSIYKLVIYTYRYTQIQIYIYIYIYSHKSVSHTHTHTHIYIYKLVSLVEGDPKVPFSITTIPRCWRGRYSIPRIAPLYP